MLRDNLEHSRDLANALAMPPQGPDLHRFLRHDVRPSDVESPHAGVGILPIGDATNAPVCIASLLPQERLCCPPCREKMKGLGLAVRKPGPRIRASMADSERTERSRLKTSLKKLHALKPADLVREDLRHRGLSFHSGLPYFERTLGMFRARLWRGNLAKLPSTHLKIMADHAERSLAQFEEILRFSGEGLADPQEVRNHLIGEVRDNYREFHDALSFLVIRPPGQPEHTARAPWYVSAPLAILLFAIFAAGMAAAYHYGLLDYAAQDIKDSLHRVARGALRELGF